MIDIEAVRADTPNCEELVHFNNAGAALSPDIVNKAVIDHLVLEQQIGGYEAADKNISKLKSFYTVFAKLLNCQAQEIASIENATRAWEMALYSINWESGDEIITGDQEYASNYLGLLHLAKCKQVKIITVPSESDGLIDPARIEKVLSRRTRLIALTHISSQRGDIQAAAEIGKVAQDNGLLYLLDACQSVGQLALDTAELGCDFLCGSGRKYLRGPRGTGFLFVRRSSLAQLNPIFVDLQAAQWQSKHDYTIADSAQAFETWESFVAGRIGLATAVDYAMNLGLADIQQRIQLLARRLSEGLRDNGRFRVFEKSSAHCGIVTFRKDSTDPLLLKDKLMAAGINTSVSRERIARLDLHPQGIGDVNRASVHYYNTEAEVDYFLSRIADL